MPQILDIPIDGGLDENADARLRDRVSIAEDVIYLRRGGFQPRPGQEQLSPTEVASWYEAGSGDKALVGRGSQLAVVTNGVVRPASFDVGDPAIDVLGSAGVASAYTVERRNVLGSCSTQRDATMAEGAGFRCYAWIDRGSALLYVSVVDADTGAAIVPPTSKATASFAFVGGPKVVFVGGWFFVLVATAGNVQCYAVDPEARTIGAPSTIPGLGTYGIGACAHPNGTHFIVARATSTTNIRVTTHVAAYPTPTLDAVTDVAIATATVTAIDISCTTAARLWLVYGTGGTATVNVRAYVARLNATNASVLTVSLAPTLIFTENQTDPTGGDRCIVWSAAILDRAAGGAWVAFTPTGRVGSNSATFFRPATALMVVDDSGGEDFARTTWAFGCALTSGIWETSSAVAFCTVMQTYPLIMQPGVGIVPALGCMHVVAFLRGNTQSTADNNGYPCQVHATFGVGQTPSGVDFNTVATSQVRSCGSPSAVVQASDETVQVLCYALERADTSPHVYAAAFTPIAARTHAQMGGRTLISGGVPAHWDGQSVVEWGFVHAPRYYGAAIANQANSIGAGTYSWAAAYEWIDANGGVMRSAPSLLISSQTLTANQKIDISITAPQLSYKADVRGGMGFQTGPAYIALFRTEANSSGPFYRLTAIEVPATNHGYYGRANVVVTDAYPDTGGASGALATFPPLYTTGDILEADPVPTCTMVTTWQGRFVIAGTDDDSVWFSTENEDGEVPYFSIGLRLAPFENGRISGLAVLDEKLVLFKPDGVFTLAGQLPNKQGVGSIPVPVQVSSDAGCIDPQSVVTFPQGVMFRSARGIYLLDRSLQVSFIGEPVARTVEASEKTVGPVLVTEQNHIRFDVNEDADGGPGSVVAYDYLRGMWTQFRYARQGETGAAPSAQLVGADGRVYWVDGNGDLWRERQANYSDTGSGLFTYRVRSGWIKAAGAQGYFTASRAGVLGKYGIPHVLTVNVYADYDEDTVVATNEWDLSTAPSAGYQFVASIATGRTARMQSIAIEAIVSARANVATAGPSAPAELSSFVLEWDPIDPAAQRRVPVAQKR